MDLLTYAVARFSESMSNTIGLDQLSDIVEHPTPQFGYPFIRNAMFHDSNKFLWMEMFQETEIVNVLDKILTDQDLQSMFENVDRFHYRKVYLPKECHKLVNRICNRIERSNKFVRYNCDGIGEPFKWIEDYAFSNQTDNITNLRIIQASLTAFVPHLKDVMVKFEPALAESLSDTWAHDYLYTQIQYIQTLPTNDRQRKKWLTENNDPLLHAIFFLEPECSAKIRSDACASCQTNAWESLPSEWRCIQQCTSGKQCSRQAEFKYGYCLHHKFNQNPIPIVSFEFHDHDKIFGLVEKVKGKIDLPEDAILMGPKLVACFALLQSHQRQKIKSNEITILSHHPPQTNAKKELDTFQTPHVIAAYQFLIGRRKTMVVTWIQTSMNPLALPQLPCLSLIKQERCVWIDLTAMQAYFRPQGFQFIAFEWENNTIPIEQWKYSIKRLQSFKFFLQQYGEVWNQCVELVSTFSKEPELFLREVIEWNVAVISSRIPIPLLALMLPPSNNRRNFMWSDVRIIKHMDRTLLWRYFPRTRAEYDSDDAFQPTQLANVTSKIISFQGRELDVNSWLQKRRQFESVKYEGNLPQGCFSVYTGDEQVDAFILEGKEEKDQSYVFLRRNGTDVIAECLKRSALQQFGTDKANLFYECFKESYRFALPDQLYIKCGIFGHVYVTKENYDFILQSDNVYFMIESTPFHQLNFSTTKKLFDNDLSVDEWDRKMELPATTGAHHCQAGTDKFIYYILPIDLKDLDLGSARKKRSVAIHT